MHLYILVRTLKSQFSLVWFILYCISLHILELKSTLVNTTQLKIIEDPPIQVDRPISIITPYLKIILIKRIKLHSLSLIICAAFIHNHRIYVWYIETHKLLA